MDGQKLVIAVIMKGLQLISFILIILNCSVLYGQDGKYRVEQSTEKTFTPLGDGMQFTWKARLTYDVFMQEPVKTCVFKVINTGYIKYKGKTYSKNEIPADVYNKLDVGVVNLAADIYDGSVKLSTVRFDYVISMDVAASPNWEEVFPGLTKEQSKSLYRKGFTIRNIRIANQPQLNGSYAMDSWLQELEKQNNFNNLISEADNLFQSQQWQQAKDKYREALRIKYGEQYPKDQIALIDQTLMEQERNEDYKRLVSEGDKLLAQGDFDAAESKYRQAQRLKPDDLQAERGLAEATEARKNKQEQEDREKADNEEDQSESNNDESETVERNKKSRTEPDRNEQRESEAQRKARLEYERQQRKLEYNRQVAQQRAANMTTAAQASNAAIQAIMWTAGIIYKDVGRDTDINIFKGDSYFLGIEGGFATSLYPIHTNSSLRSYNGNTTRYTDETVNHQTWTFDLQAGLEFWPVFGKTHGFGVFGSGIIGANIILFEHTTLEGRYGFRGFFGHKVAKLYGEYARGSRVLNHSPWVDPEQSGNGKAKYDYQRFKVGARFSFDGDFMGPTTMHIDVLPMFELPAFRDLTFGNNPIIFRWNPGIHLGFWAQNRLRIFAEMNWGLTRTGENEFGYADEATSTGISFRAGVIRRFDIFGSGAYQYEPTEVANFLRKSHKWAFSVGNPTVDWAAVKDSNYFNYRVNLSSQWFLVEKDINIIPNISGVIGVAMSGPRGVQLRVNADTTQVWNGETHQPGSDHRIGYLNASIPIGVRFSTSPLGNANYWIRGSYVNKINFLHGEIFDNSMSNDFELYMMAVEAALGVDISVGPYMGLRLGAVYQHDLRPLSNSIRVRSRSLYVQLGIII